MHFHFAGISEVQYFMSNEIKKKTHISRINTTAIWDTATQSKSIARILFLFFLSSGEGAKNSAIFSAAQIAAIHCTVYMICKENRMEKIVGAKDTRYRK